MNLELFKHFYTFFKRLDPAADKTVWLSGAYAVQLNQEGHSCLFLPEYAGKFLFDEELSPGENFMMPSCEEWAQKLKNSGLVGGSENDPYLLLVWVYKLTTF